ncbi:MAG: hypothetical protein EHM38_09190 [Geobacteraceae bacterium]|nr:MAG: hypothetical protein EHM38_09190 [Geobacteraceae bacterium]
MKKYFLSSQYKLLQLGVGLGLSALIAIFFFPIWKIPVFNLFPLILLSFTIISAIYWIRKENIAISEEGMEYEGPDVAFRTKWESIEKISSGWYFPIKTEGLIVDKSSIRVTKMAIGTVKRFPLWISSQKVFIPLSCFSNNWRDSEIGQQIKQYAPQLFEKEKSA